MFFQVFDINSVWWSIISWMFLTERVVFHFDATFFVKRGSVDRDKAKS